MATVEEILSAKLTLEELKEKLANNDESKSAISGQIQLVKHNVLPLRLSFNDFLKTMSQIEHLNDKSPQEKFLLIRAKVLELYGKLKELVRDFQKLMPLLDTMAVFSESNEQKFYPLETLNLLPDPIKSTASPSYKKAVNKSNAETPSSNAATPSAALSSNNVVLVGPQAKNQRRPRTNNKRQPSGTASAAPSAGSAGSAPISGATPMMISGVSPLNMVASPLNGISPNRKPQQPHHQTTPTAATLSIHSSQQKQIAMQGKGTPSKTPVLSAANLTPQSILTMSAFENNANSIPTSTLSINSGPNQATMGFSADLDNLDLNALELGSLNMDLLG
ncbi:Pgd1p Ecym_1430 [Eremothecium cymbalariae DBVPG|uniref:Mediator complex subunit 3 n=1 Tax=Eremothecium cymbalariae (strain CBS 270.75 / DBVPG 7215 / KCTC 17166 / NRRL Y-17582) TaxID=931890 RepID=G8JM86_ERECY|nr:hypothetical protein Ecym_1430 [Eremothecium cymbalariae DBVPG\